MLNYQLLLRDLPTLLTRPAWNLSTMTPEHMSDTITAARANFVSISSKPKDDDIICLREFLMQILLVIPYNTTDSNHNLWGILSSNDVLKAQHHEVFDPPTRPVVYLTIPGNATSVVRSRSEIFQKMLWHDSNLHEAAGCGCCAFIINTIEETCTHKL